MAICGYCNHPGYHAQFIPPGAEPSRRCGDCPRVGTNWTGGRKGTGSEATDPGAGRPGSGSSRSSRRSRHASRRRSCAA
jgi:hypothetical protein